MAQHKSALKRHRQSLKRRARNHAMKTSVRTVVKAARAAADGHAADAASLIKEAQVALARAGVKGVIHKRAMARRIGRLARLQNKLAKSGAAKPAEAKAPSAKAPAKKAAPAKK